MYSKYAFKISSDKMEYLCLEPSDNLKLNETKIPAAQNYVSQLYREKNLLRSDNVNFPRHKLWGCFQLIIWFEYHIHEKAKLVR